MSSDGRSEATPNSLEAYCTQWLPDSVATCRDQPLFVEPSTHAWTSAATSNVTHCALDGTTTESVTAGAMPGWLSHVIVVSLHEAVTACSSWTRPGPPAEGLPFMQSV